MGPDTVAPLAGAWIEIRSPRLPFSLSVVAPLAGAWIEIFRMASMSILGDVAPLAGAWIEIVLYARRKFDWITSHPSRVRGLK